MRKLRIFEPDGKSFCAHYHITRAKIHRNLILSGLGIKLILDKTANEHCALLLAVDPKIEEKRAQLRREMDKLVVAKQWLESLYREDTPNLPSRGRHMMVEDEGEGEAVGEGEEQGDVQGYAHDGSGSVV